MNAGFHKCPYFESLRLKYRGITAEDAELMVMWRSTPEIYQFFDNPFPITMTEHVEWFVEYMDSPNKLSVLIMEKSGRPIGVVGGYCDCVRKGFVLSYYIAPMDCRGKGYAGEAILSFINYIHSCTGLSLFLAYIHPSNLSSISCVEKVGFHLSNEDAKPGSLTYVITFVDENRCK